VAEEAVLTAQLMGNRVEHSLTWAWRDHRLLEHRKHLTEARVIIASRHGRRAAERRGRLVGVPVIAVPTSRAMARALAAWRRCWEC